MIVGLTGGGVRCVASLGVLQHLSENGRLTNLSEIRAGSGGTLASFIYLIEPNKQKQLELLKYVGGKEIMVVDLINLPINYSLLNNSGFVSILYEILKNEYGLEDISFIEMYNKSKIHFKVYVFNIDERRLEYFDHVKNPKLSVVTAICASCAIPIIFPPVKIGGSMYIDAGIKIRSSVPLDEDIDLVIRTTPTRFNKDTGNNFLTYIMNIFDIVWDLNEPINKSKKTILFNPPCSTLEMTLTFEKAKQLVQCGWEVSDNNKI